MRNIAAVFFIAIMVFSFGSCKETIVTWEDNSEPGRRDYVWTIIDSTGNDLHLSKIWGDRPDNIWIGGGFAFKPEERLWHYDGNSLKAVGIKDFYPNGMFGFDKNLVYATFESTLWKYDGNNWTKDLTIDHSSFYPNFHLGLYDITGTAQNDLWLVGTVNDQTGTAENGVLFRKDNYGWKFKKITKNQNTAFYKVFPGYEKEQCFVLGVKQKFIPWVDSSAVFEYNNGNLKQIHIGVMEDMENGCALNKINGIIYITIGKKIYRYFEGKLYEYLTVNHPDFVFAVYGRNEKDLFLWAKEGLLHYNGTNIEYVYQSKWPVFILERVLLFDNDVYICALNRNNGRYYFIKGVLPEKL